MRLFRKKEIISRILDYSAKFEIESGNPPTDILLNKEELKEVYDYFKGWDTFLLESYNKQQNMVLGLIIHAEHEGNTNFRMIDYK